MDIYVYHYNCPRWYGWQSGTRRLYVEGAVHPEQAVKSDAKKISGSDDCDIHLIQKFTMVIKDVETYPAMACLPLHKCKIPHHNA